LLSSDLTITLKTPLERRQYIYNILVEYYKESRSTIEIAEKRNALPATVNQQRNWGLCRIRTILRGYTDPNTLIAPSPRLKPAIPYTEPVTFAEYNELIQRKSELRKQYKQEAQHRKDEELHGPLSPEESIRRIDPLCLHMRIINSLERYGVTTVGQFLALTGDEGSQCWCKRLDRDKGPAG